MGIGSFALASTFALPKYYRVVLVGVEAAKEETAQNMNSFEMKELTRTGR
jgi:hypothetical protein